MKTLQNIFPWSSRFQLLDDNAQFFQPVSNLKVRTWFFWKKLTKLFFWAGRTQIWHNKSENYRSKSTKSLVSQKIAAANFFPDTKRDKVKQHQVHTTAQRWKKRLLKFFNIFSAKSFLWTHISKLLEENWKAFRSVFDKNCKNFELAKKRLPKLIFRARRIQMWLKQLKTSAYDPKEVQFLESLPFLLQN